MLSSILNELKEENDRLLHSEPQHWKILLSKNRGGEKQPTILQQQRTTHNLILITHHRNRRRKKIKVSMSNLSRVLQLHDQGLASVEIAEAARNGEDRSRIDSFNEENGENKRKS